MPHNSRTLTLTIPYAIANASVNAVNPASRVLGAVNCATICVIRRVAYDLKGRPMNHSNLGSSIGRRGLGAPGDRITSIGANGKPLTQGGTSAAAPFVTGAIALLWSEFPTATATEIKFAATKAYTPRRTTVVARLLDAWVAYRFLAKTRIYRR